MRYDYCNQSDSHALTCLHARLCNQIKERSSDHNTHRLQASVVSVVIVQCYFGIDLQRLLQLKFYINIFTLLYLHWQDRNVLTWFENFWGEIKNSYGGMGDKEERNRGMEKIIFLMNLLWIAYRPNCFLLHFICTSALTVSSRALLVWL